MTRGYVFQGEHALKIFLPTLPTEIQIVPAQGDFEYYKVLFPSLVTGKENGLGRDQVDDLMNKFFEEKYPGAAAAARVAKKLFISVEADLPPKHPWSSMLVYMLYHEYSQNPDNLAADFGGNDLFRRLLRDLGSWPFPPANSSVGKLKRWAKQEHPEVKDAVYRAFGIWAKTARQIFTCGEELGE